MPSVLPVSASVPLCLYLAISLLLLSLAHSLTLSLSLSVSLYPSKFSLKFEVLVCSCSYSSFLNNQGTAISIMNAKATFLGSLVAHGNTGEKGGLLHIAEFGSANMSEVGKHADWNPFFKPVCSHLLSNF